MCEVKNDLEGFCLEFIRWVEVGKLYCVCEVWESWVLCININYYVLVLVFKWYL